MWLNLIGWKCGASRPGQSQSEGDQNRSNRELLSTLNWTRLNYSTPWNNFRLYRELRFCWCTVFLWVTLFMKLLCFLQCIFFFLFNFLPLLFFFNRCCFFKFFSFFFFCDLPGFFLSLLISIQQKYIYECYSLKRLYVVFFCIIQHQMVTSPSLREKWPFSSSFPYMYFYS